MKKKIVVPTDFSTNSINAIRYAIDMYSKEAIEIEILHTYYSAGYDSENLLIPIPDDTNLEKIRIKAELDLATFKDQLQFNDANVNHTIFYTAQFGPLVDILEKKVKAEKIHLIIMGTKGQAPYESTVFGSNAVNVMEKVRNCPILAVPINYAFKKPNEIIFPTGFKTIYHKDEIKYLIEIAQLTEAPIRILYISKGEDLTNKQIEKKQLLENMLSGVTFTHHNLYHIPVEDGVRCFIQSRESEMIAFVNKKHFFFGSIFSNPLAKHLGKFTTVPLLAMHDR